MMMMRMMSRPESDNEYLFNILYILYKYQIAILLTNCMYEAGYWQVFPSEIDESIGKH